MEKDKAEEKSEDKSEKEKGELESKVKVMEERIKELEKSLGEKKQTEHYEGSIVGDLVSSLIPGFGKIVKTLEKTSPEFRQRIAETDSEIKHRLETGWNEKKPTISYGLSIRPLDTRSTKISTRGSIRESPKTEIQEVKIESAEIEPVFDVFEEDNYISVIAEIPGASEEDIRIEIEGSKLMISAGLYSRTVILPAEADEIKEKSFKNGVLQLKIKRKKNAD
jgi:Molecular chaperone (small heat shock protein)